MPNIDIAHIHEQGQDMIIAPLDGAFGNRTQGEQNSMLGAIQAAAHSAGLRGTAVIVWQAGRRFNFMGPQRWHPFLRSIDMRWVSANINKSLSW